MLRSPVVSNPAAAMASTVRRFGSQPAANHDHGFAIRSWNRPVAPLPADMLEDNQPASGYEHPPDLARVAATSSTEHNTSPMCTESKLLSGKGIDSPVPSTMSTAMPWRSGATRRHPPERRLRLHGGDRRHRGRHKHQVGSRTETDHQQPAGRMCSSPHGDIGGRTAGRRSADRVDTRTGTTDYSRVICYQDPFGTADIRHASKTHTRPPDNAIERCP